MEFDHQQAVDSQAVERYLLGELSSPLREQFEDHYFTCSQCAEALRDGYALRENVRALLRGGSHSAQAAKVAPAEGSVPRDPDAVSQRKTGPIPIAEGRSGLRRRAAFALPWAAALFFAFVAWRERGVDHSTAAADSAILINLQAQARDAGESTVKTVPVNGAGGKIVLTLDLPADGVYRWMVHPAAAAPAEVSFRGQGTATNGVLAVILDSGSFPAGQYGVTVQSLESGAETPERHYGFRVKSL